MVSSSLFRRTIVSEKDVLNAGKLRGQHKPRFIIIQAEFGVIYGIGDE